MTTSLLQVRCNDIEKEAWLKASGELPLSRWVKQVLNERAGTDPFVVKKSSSKQSVQKVAPEAKVVPKFALGTCSADVAWGTKCKLCGKVHT